ncbi:hypothetical protein M758_1G169300 [Ceratodon purpureus]|uniref:Protein kinase domain-containing protein n=1 Tax=Ceratodon purpureus TaxID=3225 RepID=A0A8T0J978_CERPU|nr:hypothetical protein KC19_1G172700 [Ceratodon purpureus]KAG0630313.1 hypothetical protein M758_1G169300 [Ceratodon purpureus]
MHQGSLRTLEVMTGPSRRVVALVLVALLLLHGTVSSSAQTLRDDEQHLFAFLKNVLPGYPSPFNTSVPTCQWQGLSCIGLGAQQRIKSLALGGLGLNGSIPYSTLGALTSLTYLDLSYNLLTGEVPWDVWSSLPNLVHLGLSNNKLTGSLPKWVNMNQLLELNLSENLFSGPIPDSFGANLRYLKQLDLHGNNFSGPMPAFTNNKFLSYLDLSSNRFTGGVSYATFYIQELLMVNLSRNLLTGTIPDEFGWLYKIRTLDLSENNFEGPIPDFYNLRELRQFHVSSNGLNGSLPVNITRLPYLWDLGFANNKLTGSLPPLPWGMSSGIIRFLDCSNNFLSGSIPWGLLASENLAVVRLARNRFTGSIPTNVTTQMQEMDLGSNNFTGDIPATFTSSHLLEKLDVSSNQLNGSIPWDSITELHSLRYLNLAYNRFAEGALPNFAQFVNLSYLNLSSSYVSGSIPDSVGELRSLLQLDLSHNQVTGNIPTNLSQTTNLMSLDLSHNNLTGEIPPELVSLMSLSTLDLSFNNLSGVVPNANQWTHFTNLSYEGNSLLCGAALNKVCPTLSSPAPSPSAPVLVAAPSLSPSGFNVPSILHRNSSSGLEAGAVVGIVIGISLAICAFLSTYLLFHKKSTYKKPRKENSSYLTGPVTFESDPCAWASLVQQPASIPVIMFEKPLLNLTFADLLQATSKFHKDSQIADGRYGPTFKGALPGGFQIVIKVLYDDGPSNELEKAAQLEAIGKIRHENLVSLVGYCLVGDERLLVYEYMENGDVHTRLHDSPDEAHHPENWTKETWADANEKFVVSEELGWPVRHRIAVGVARALAFLHHGCVPNVVHRDVTSSNILLDSQYEPHLADCGLAELVGSGKRYEMDLTVTEPVLGGTPGYVPPEYGQTWKATARGDVYSFGVVLLELVTGKSPTGQYFHDSYGGNLVGWVRTLIREKRGYKCLDPKLLSSGVESEMLECLRIGYLCTAELPSKRPTMQQVVGLLKDVHVDIVTCM